MNGSLSQLSNARPGGHRLRPEVVAYHQRERILAAVVELVAERGYRAVTVADIVKRGKVARQRFYENFASKEDCFLAAYDRAREEALRRVGEATASAGDSFPARVSAGIAALLGYMSEQPELARACLLEAPSLGRALSERNQRAREGFAEQLRGGRGETSAPEPPAAVEDSVLGGLYWLIYQALLSGQPQRIEDLRPNLVEFALAPFLGAEAARRASAG
jgi:AcrR family transcriptional regulator